MRWFMSKLLRQDPVATIVHQFVCSSCEGIDEIETELSRSMSLRMVRRKPGLRRELLKRLSEVA